MKVKKKKQTKKVEPLKFARNFERDGVNLYIELAGKTQNMLAKKLFYSLSKQEVDHISDIDNIFHSLKENTDVNLGEMMGQSHVEDELKQFFTSARNVDFKKNAVNISGYELAIDMEKKGYKIYDNFENMAKTDLERKFFGLLKNEEKEHLEALLNVYNYLKNTGDWFQEEESKVWNWMNI